MSGRRQSDHTKARVLRAALRRSMTALDDWINTYADDQCDQKRVKEAHDRIGEFGTIGYIANVQAQNRSALKGKKK